MESDTHVTSKGDAAFVGIGFRAASREALDRLAASFGASVADCPHPGGGLYVVGADPDGRRLEFVFGAKRSAPATPRSSGTTRMQESGSGRSSVLPMGRRTFSAWAMSRC
jgi:hypothetical protein